MTAKNQTTNVFLLPKVNTINWKRNNTKLLKEKIILVTGGTRNVGKGIAIGLGEAGATVYVTGRSITDKDEV